MATRVVVLTKEPQLITSKAALLESKGGSFNYVFSNTVPTNILGNHTDNKVYTDGSLGGLYAWKSSTIGVHLVVSEAI